MTAPAAETTIPTRFPVQIVLPVQWGDMDAYAHVNNAVYFRWFESARIAYMGRLGGMPVLAPGRQAPILASTRCDFRAPLVYPDTVEVSIGVHRVRRSSFGMSIRVDSRARGGAQGGTDARAAEGEAVMVWYDYERKRPAPLDPRVRQAILELEGVATE